MLPIGLGGQRPGKRRSGQHQHGWRGGGNYYASGFQQWTLPFGSASAACWVALFAQAHMDRYGTTPEQLAQIALNARRNAALNPKAIYRDPMSLDDYFNSRMITTPLRLFDCDVPCDGATAVIVSRRERAVDLAKPPIYIEAMGTAMHDRPSWDQLRDPTRTVGADAAAQMWSRTSLTPGRRRRGRALRRLQLLDHAVAGGARALSGGRERALRRGRPPASPATAPCPSTPTAASCRAVDSTATGSSTRPACSCEEKGASVNCPPGPPWPPWLPAEGTPVAACCSPTLLEPSPWPGPLDGEAGTRR